MSPSDRSGWVLKDSYAAMNSATSEDDLSSFLDLENMDLNFPLLDPNDLNLDGSAPQPDDGEPHTYGKSEFAQQQQYSSNEQDAVQHHWIQEQRDARKLNPSEFNPNQTAEDHWIQEQNFRQQYGIPPTPNSSQMYPGQYVQQQMYQQSQQYRRYQTDDGIATFTPKDSPYFVGNESSFSVAEFADAGHYTLDPLTSPALNPQSDHQHGSAHSSTHESSVAGSPTTVDLDDNNTSTNDRPRKTRKRAQAPTSTPSSVPPKPAGSAASRKRKGSMTTRSQARGSTDSTPMSQSRGPLHISRAESLVTQRNGTVSSSTSPHPQHEMPMAPPPKPGSLKSTPNLRPQQTSNSDGYPPATPASLMQLQQQERSGSLETMSPATPGGQLHLPMEELVLPEAAAPAENLRSNTKPVLLSSAHGTPSLSTTTPSTAPGSAMSPIQSNSSSAKYNQSRNSRKRNSTSSTLVSPALRPRISPSIKPLLPDGAQHNISEETHALLLASKSNYQNLLEGNHLPGVNYPSELSTNLTSKRTSHKIAEQGRRNRINTALQEMQSLLPASPGGGGNGGNWSGASPSDLNGSAEDDVAGGKTPITPTQAANSKAATVELAIEYIKKLNSKLADRENENERLRHEMAALQAKLNNAT